MKSRDLISTMQYDRQKLKKQARVMKMNGKRLKAKESKAERMQKIRSFGSVKNEKIIKKPLKKMKRGKLLKI